MNIKKLISILSFLIIISTFLVTQSFGQKRFANLPASKDSSYVREARAKIDEDIHINPNPNKREFSMWDTDGYYIIVTEYHEYEG